MIKIFQDKNIDLLQTKKTVDWLVNNTSVSVFNPIDFKGYQRQIDNKHCMRIVDYLKNEFFLPTAIVCATDNDYSEDAELRIVDGQHRIRAFQIVRDENPERYSQIKQYEIPVIVMAKTDENTEIDTFITINKTSKKVDTSLALVLKNKMNKYNMSDDLTMPKAEYLAIEIACALNLSDDSANLWFDKISFEGTPKKNSAQLISLNAFVKATRPLINYMSKNKMISLEWSSEEEIKLTIDKCCKIFLSIWNIIKIKWNELFDYDLEKRRIIQGAIGCSAINRVLAFVLNKSIFENEYDFIYEVESYLKSCSLDSSVWLPGNTFSKYSSESGYSIVAQEIINSISI